MAYPPACPHDPIEELAPDVFMVRGSVRLNPLMRITRNMAILRHGGELTLVNPIRLDEGGESRLRVLGEVRRLFRLGPLHGQDDPYYVDQFGAELWTPGPSETYPEPKAQGQLADGAELPVAGVEVIAFQGSKQAEVALLLPQHRLLLTCDAIQHYGDYRHNTLLARLVMPFIGFPRTTVVGPIWLKVMTPEGVDSLEPEFRRLLELRFDRLLSAHGSLLASGAHASVEAAVDRAFAKK